MNELMQLAVKCNDGERYLIEKLLENAADYVRAVIIMEASASNVQGLDGEEFRQDRQSTDRSRTYAHNAFISSVDSVNRICDKYQLPRIYTGSTERRAYGDFALQLVTDIFENRH